VVVTELGFELIGGLTAASHRGCGGGHGGGATLAMGGWWVGWKGRLAEKEEEGRQRLERSWEGGG
jgi:hypothetical protein